MRVVLLLVLVAACVPEDAAERYATSASFRRAELEAALWRPELPYSRSLLSAYGRGSSGWDLLPVLELDAPAPGTDPARLGEWAFFQAPMRSDAYITWLASQPQLWDDVGLELTPEGKVRGLVEYRSPTGEVRVGVSCALCHAAGGEAGRPSRTLDLGLARALHAEARGRVADPTWRTWGPGRADVTDEKTTTVTRIPALWGVRHARYLNSSGVIEMHGAATLAIRFETQFILGHELSMRPDRAQMWALAEYVLALRPPSTPRAGAMPDAFERRCAGCHDPDRGFAGGLVPAAALTSDRRASRDLERGTGFYKVPDLLGLAERAPYLHDGSAPTLSALLAGGHPRGEVIPDAEASAIVEYLTPLEQ